MMEETPTLAERTSELLPTAPLEAFLDAHGLGCGAIEATRIGDGASNLTFLVEREGARVVLRRPPPPPLPRDRLPARGGRAREPADDRGARRLSARQRDDRRRVVSMSVCARWGSGRSMT
jgi:hypothetical protein